MLTVFSMQKTIIRISEKRSIAMVNMYLHEYIRHRYHRGLEIDVESLGTFGNKISSLQEMPEPEIVSLYVSPKQNDDDQRSRLIFVYKINNQNQEIKIDMI